MYLHCIFVCLFTYLVLASNPYKRLWDKNNRIETICFVCIKWALDDVVSFVFGFVCVCIWYRYSRCETVILLKLTTNSVCIEDFPWNPMPFVLVLRHIKSQNSTLFQTVNAIFIFKVVPYCIQIHRPPCNSKPVCCQLQMYTWSKYSICLYYAKISFTSKKYIWFYFIG